MSEPHHDRPTKKREFGGYLVPLETLLQLRRAALDAMILCMAIGAIIGAALRDAWWVVSGLAALWFLHPSLLRLGRRLYRWRHNTPGGQP